MTVGSVLLAAVTAQEACEKLGLAFCVIGGVALQRWGEPRFTADADISVLIEPGQERRVAEALLRELPARIDDAIGFATRTRVVLARSADNVGVTSILERQGKKLDLDLIRQELVPLLEAKGEPDLLAELEKRIKRHL